MSHPQTPFGNENPAPLTPEWWFKKASTKLEAERQRFEPLWKYFTGNPPTYDYLNTVGKEMMVKFHERSRSNFAALVVEAARQRMTLRGFRTSSESDETGDKDAWSMFQRAGGEIFASDVHDWMLAMSRAYVIVGPIDPDTDAPVITAEDPRQVTTINDPARPGHVMCALKMYHNTLTETDEAILYLPNGTHTFTRGKAGTTSFPDAYGQVTFGALAHWQKIKSDGQELGQVPVTRFLNQKSVGEFENHLDLLDRINHMIFQRLMIATMQAFRQRALKNAPSHYPEDWPDVALRSTPIPYDKMFYSSPDAFWLLPPGVDGLPIDIWESMSTDLTPILGAVKEDLIHLAAITSTPLHYLNPDAATQSAEGATLQREGLVFRVEDRIGRVNQSWSRVMSQAFLRMGDKERAKLAAINPLWRGIERRSLTERAQAAMAAKNDVPWRARMIHIWGFDPDEVDRMEGEREQERLAEIAYAGALAQATAPPEPPEGEEEPADSDKAA